MTSPDVPTAQQGLSTAASEPLLEPGDRLSRHEFERRYDRMPQLKKAELVAEIVGSSRAYDLHQKKAVYRRHGVLEYLAWITGENRLLWWQLQQDEYREIDASEEGRIKSGIFPGLWLDSAALLHGDMKTVLEVLRHGLESSEYKTFLAH